MKVILASQSPRRRDLLIQMGLHDFKIIPAVQEEHIESGLSPEQTVMYLARQKAEEVGSAHPDALIIAADTMVFLDGCLLGKPHNADEARCMLRRLSGRIHQVFSGVSVRNNTRNVTEYECTQVQFRDLSEGEIDAYLRTGEPLDKAGAYGAQGLGTMLIQRIDGDFFNVMGLPVCRLYLILKQFGLDLLKVNQ